MGAVQKAFSWQELAVLVSGYNYAAIVLVDSRYLYPAAYRATPGAPALTPPSPALSAASSTWNTPKRQRDDGQGDMRRREGGRRDESEAPSRRRRRRPGGVQGGVDHEGEEAHNAVVLGDPPLPSPLSTPPVMPSARLAGGQEEEEGKDGRRDPSIPDLRAADAARAVKGGEGGVSVAPRAIPPSRGVRKSLGSDFFDGEAERRASLSLSAAAAAAAAAHARLSPLSTSSTATEGTSGTVSTPFSSPMLASPPPLKPAVLCAPVSTANATTTATSPRIAGGDAASTPTDSAYCGHYLLLVGWSEADGVFIARDPALPSSAGAPGDGSSSDAHVFIALTPDALDRARRSYGTDEDVLVIDLARSRKGGVTAAPLAAAAAATALAASAASPAAAASAMVGLFAMAAAAAAAGADASMFREWGWPVPAAWFGGNSSSSGGAGGGNGGGGRDGAPGSNPGSVGVGLGSQQGGAESASKRLASLLSLAASGWRFPTVGDAYRGPRPWGAGGTKAGQVGEEGEEEEGERWAVRMASAMEGLLEGGRRAAYTMEGLLQGGRRAAYSMEGLLRAAYAMESLLEGGRRAAYSLRDSLADVAEAPGGAGAECCGAMARECPGTPVPGAARVISSPA